jgi:phosphoribosylformimino-5-aminoimidazole carboxamide ribotide isomerase
MLIIPAIDLLGGKTVRLSKGVEASAVVYSDRPAAMAAEFEAAGAKWIHVVDLDAAFGRPDVNAVAIERILRSVRIPVEDPGLISNAVEEHGCERIVVGIDVRNGRVAIRGWTEDGAADYLDLARDMQLLGILRVIVTEISTDGMLSGPKLEPMSRIARETGLSVIVSGGVGTLSDLEEVDRCGGAEKRRIEGVIVGKALYEKRFSLKKALHRFQKGNGDSTA